MEATNDPEIFGKAENLPEGFQSPKQGKIPKKEILKVIQFLDNDPTITLPREVGTTEENPELINRPILSTRTLGTVGTKKGSSEPDTKGVSNFQSWSQKTPDEKPGKLKKSRLKHDLNTSGNHTVHPRKGLRSHKGFKRQHDANGVSNFQLDHNDQIVRTSSGHPRCNYCLIASHTRVSCKFRQHDLNGGIDRTVHPQRGLLSYKSLKSNPEVKSGREVTVTSHSWSQETPGKKPGVLKETKLKSSPTQKTPEIYENEDPKIFKKKGNLPGEFQPPKQGRISNKEISKIIQFLDNECDREVDNAPQSWFQKTPGEKPGILKETKLKSSPAQRTPKIYENKDPEIFKEKENLPTLYFYNSCVPEEFQSPKQKISNKETSKIINVDHAVHPQKGLLSYENFKDNPEIKCDRIARQHTTGLPSFWDAIIPLPTTPYLQPNTPAPFGVLSPKQEDLDNNVDRTVHPQKGLLSYDSFEGNREVKCDHEASKAPQIPVSKNSGPANPTTTWLDENLDNNVDRAVHPQRDTKLESSPAQETPKLSENEGLQIFKKKENYQNNTNHSRTDRPTPQLHGSTNLTQFPLKGYLDEEGVPNYHLDGNNRVVRTDSGHPRCNYCLIESHPRVSCKIRQRDLLFNIDHVVHPLKGCLDEKGVPDYHLDGNNQIARNNSGSPLCNYCLSPSHPRTSCEFRRIDLNNNVDYIVHPWKGYYDPKRDMTSTTNVDHVVHPQKGSYDPKRQTTRHPNHLKYRQAYRHRNTQTSQPHNDMARQI
jgi:hypothetical protein